ncbi:MAG: hypothetical protein D6726_00285 [Nitrospirae bacterium]|nr:MAG: hypothetical protein D6726_00285 [Nitrospirota bacterium]
MRVLIILLMVLTFAGCRANQTDVEPFKEEKAELIQVTPERPVRITLKRGSSGRYSWELKGENVEKVISADQKLREYINKTKEGGKN